MKVHLMTFGDQVRDPHTGVLQTVPERHRSIIEQAAAADAAGFAGINIGEHHAGEFASAAPPVILAAIAERTTNLRLGTAVTLLANLDAFRVAEDYATLDVISGGRVDLVAGRGNLFPHTYRLFGQSVDDSRQLFEENVHLVLAAWSGQEVHWKGLGRPPIHGARLQPLPVQQPHPPLWIGGGGSSETADLAARLALPMALPSAFGEPNRFRPVVDAYRERVEAHGSQRTAQVAASWHLNVGRNSGDTKRRWEPRYRAYSDWFASMVKAQNPDYQPHTFDFEWMTTEGPAIAGSPAEVTERLAKLTALLDVDVHLVYLDMGGMPPGEAIEMIELIGAEVLPALP
ncbi:MAG TPA: LLM class flavin-dependent oxidoreductase [Acidimicrobiia bacterium]|nr:LLM class flavin-dependent oxidoreductase [Acidimicrobiia bacterium]